MLLFAVDLMWICLFFPDVLTYRDRDLGIVQPRLCMTYTL